MIERRPTMLWILLVAVGCGGGDDTDELRSQAVQNGLGELRRMQETGGSPLNACRTRLQDAVKRVGRGPVVESLGNVGPMLCLAESTFVDCVSRWQDRFHDVCGRNSFDSIAPPNAGKPGDGKRFLADLAAARPAYEAAVAAASTAKPTALYRERCRWGSNGSGFEVGYQDVNTGRISTYGTAACDAELTTLDAALAPTATILATATVAAHHGPAGADSVDRANHEALEAARKQARDALLAKVQGATR